MKTVIIVNPRAGGGRVLARWEAYNRSICRALGPAQVRFTATACEATDKTRDSILEGFERIVVVGGDGTLNECLNGFFDPSGTRFIGAHVCLVPYPAGTGGDFARSIGLHAHKLEGALRGATERRVDIGRATFTAPRGQPILRHFLNIASFGASGLVVEKVNSTHKFFGGRLSFLLGTVRGLLAYDNQPLRLQVDDIFDEQVTINTVVVANGRYFGGAMKVAPQACIDDGLLDVVLLEDIGLREFFAYSRRLYGGRHLGLPGIRLLRGRRVCATPLGSEPIHIDLDGEQPGRLPGRFEVLPQLLRVYAPWAHAEAISPGM